MVTFTVNGMPAREAIEWLPGLRPSVDIVVGPEFATYFGKIAVAGGSEAQGVVVPYIDGVVCGEQLSGDVDPGVIAYFVVVDPYELRESCGATGKLVEFRLERESGSAEVLGTARWDTAATVDLGTDTIDQPGATPATETMSPQ